MNRDHNRLVEMTHTHKPVLPQDANAAGDEEFQPWLLLSIGAHATPTPVLKHFFRLPVLAPPYFFTAKALDLGLAVSIDQYASLNKRCSASSSRQLTQALLKASNILI
jgi:hypothetical protein